MIWINNLFRLTCEINSFFREKTTTPLFSLIVAPKSIEVVNDRLLHTLYKHVPGPQSPSTVSRYSRGDTIHKKPQHDLDTAWCVRITDQSLFGTGESVFTGPSKWLYRGVEPGGGVHPIRDVFAVLSRQPHAPPPPSLHSILAVIICSALAVSRGLYKGLSIPKISWFGLAHIGAMLRG